MDCPNVHLSVATSFLRAAGLPTGLERLLATHVVAMVLEVILCQTFSECVSNLLFCVDREDIDKSLAHMFVKMMIANIYVFGSWT